MKPHPKLRKTVKWSGAAATVLLLIVWIGGMRVEAWCYPTNHSSLGVYGGRVQVRWYKIENVSDFHAHSVASVYPAWLNHWWFDYKDMLDVTDLFIPVWILIPIPLAAAATAWRLDTLARRRARAGGCPKCHYDRAGLSAEAVCPECGAAAPSPPPTPPAPPTSVP